MAYKTIISFLFIFFFQNVVCAQFEALGEFKKLQNSVDSIVKNAIRQNAFPGCTVLGVRHGRPFFFQSYGYHTYDSLNSTHNSDLYDLASITKVMAATLAMMKLYDEQLIDLEKPISAYVSRLGNSKVGRVTVRECLGHQGGVKSWIPYYQRIKRKNGKYKHKTISSDSSQAYSYQIADGKFLHNDFYLKIKKMIRRSPVEKDPHYVYSGLFYYLVPEIVQNLTGKSFEEYLNDHFYRPMQLSTVMFNPLEKFDLKRIVPTEVDSFFRFHAIHGIVHDEGAIMMRGVSGNAGLFSDAKDLASLGQMLSQNGMYEGRQYLKASTVDLFTAYQYANKNNRRGLGFDKQVLDLTKGGSYVAQSSSVSSFGHTGYTGTFLWVDPEIDFVFVFMSNRVYPTRDRRMLYDLNVRPILHQLFYDYIGHSKEN